MDVLVEGLSDWLQEDREMLFKGCHRFALDMELEGSSTSG
jgi:hypothetical protein